MKMKFVILCCLLALFYSVRCKGVRATESMGQEIIEIGTPVKELPPEIEEEPSAEVDDDYKQLTTMKTMVNTVSTATKKIHQIRTSKEESSEEVKVEQELNEAYRDLDYKDTSELKKLNSSSEVASKPIARAKSSFKFQPDLMNPQEVEKFRTSVDEISCEISTQKLSKNDDGIPGKAIRSTINTVLCAISLAVVYY